MAFLPYVAPFAVFVGLLAIKSSLTPPGVAGQLLWIAVPALVLAAVSRSVLDFRIRHWGGTLAVGAGAFLVWIAPDLLIPGYRGHWLFTNAISGVVQAGLPGAERAQPMVLILRGLRAALIVPVLEELFWRGWLMRWLIDQDFQRVPLGAYTAQSFWIVAILFGTEHGPFWDVGLAAGILYNAWMVHTRSLGDLIAAHALTNLCLSVYVVAAGRWEYWG